MTEMSAKEESMARLLARTGRAKRFTAVMEFARSDASTILDLGCGIGALTTNLAEKFPSALIVGIDRSKYLLSKLQKKGIAWTVLADISALPLREAFFDVAVAVQVLHEILSSKGAHALIKTLQGIRSSLSQDGELVIFDHVSPGDTPVFLKLSREMLRKFREFQAKFKYRKIACNNHGEGLVEVSMRDFYDFLTKIWALHSELEEEEMNETHTPFTRQEIEDLLQKAGFKIVRLASLTPVHSRKGITVQSKVELPDRHIILLAKKRNICG